MVYINKLRNRKTTGNKVYYKFIDACMITTVDDYEIYVRRFYYHDRDHALSGKEYFEDLYDYTICSITPLKDKDGYILLVTSVIDGNSSYNIDKVIEKLHNL